MKAEKVTGKNTFNPIELSITIESVEDLRELVSLLGKSTKSCTIPLFNILKELEKEI